MNKYLYEEENQPDPLLRTTYCPVSFAMQTKQSLPVFFNSVANAQSKEEILEAGYRYAEAQGCYSNMPQSVIDKLIEFGFLKAHEAA